MLKGKQSYANVITNGNPDLVAGYSVAVKEHNTGLIGSFLIKNDNHVFQDGDYYVDMELIFDNVMDKVELEEREKKKKKREEVEWDFIERIK